MSQLVPNTRIHRRSLLQAGVATLLGASAGPICFERSVLANVADQPQPGKVIVCVFLRGAVDGLHMVVPYAEPAYYKERENIAVAAPGKGKNSALYLDQRFALHPKLAALLPLYKNGKLAIVHAVGSAEPSRSHFDAQDYMETATASSSARRRGWVNRCLTVRHGLVSSPLRAVAMGGAEPLALQGSAPVTVMQKLEAFGLRGGRKSQLKLELGFRALYEASDDPLARAGKEALDLIERVRMKVERVPGPENGAEYPKRGQQFSDVARLIKADLGVEFAWLDVGGWDTHFNQGAGEGQLGSKLEELGRSLAAFHRDLGKRMKDVVVLTLSEFGRTIRQNGTLGTDHGHGTAMFVLGGKVRGGKVHGRWPGLEPEQRFEERDLAVTTDFRDLLAEILTRHGGIANLTPIFPDHVISPSTFPGVLA